MVFDISERQMQYVLFFKKKIAPLIFSLIGNINIMVGFISHI